MPAAIDWPSQFTSPGGIFLRCSFMRGSRGQAATTRYLFWPIVVAVVGLVLSFWLDCALNGTLAGDCPSS